jgi:hypothetical protein
LAPHAVVDVSGEKDDDLLTATVDDLDTAHGASPPLLTVPLEKLDGNRGMALISSSRGRRRHALSMIAGLRKLESGLTYQ